MLEVYILYVLICSFSLYFCYEFNLLVMDCKHKDYKTIKRKMNLKICKTHIQVERYTNIMQTK